MPFKNLPSFRNISFCYFLNPKLHSAARKGRINTKIPFGHFGDKDVSEFVDFENQILPIGLCAFETGPTRTLEKINHQFWDTEQAHK